MTDLRLLDELFVLVFVQSLLNAILINLSFSQCVKSVRIWSYFGTYFPAFELYTERYFVSLRIPSEVREYTD